MSNWVKGLELGIAIQKMVSLVGVVFGQAHGIFEGCSSAMMGHVTSGPWGALC